MSNLEWIKDIVYLLPICALIWKAAVLSSKVRQNETDIDEIKGDTDRSSREILKRLDIISDKLNLMQIDMAVMKEFKETQEHRKNGKQAD